MPDFVLEVVGGRRMWRHTATGRYLPVVSGGSGDEPDDGNSFKPITSQDDLNRALAERLARERSKFADYDELKAKAAELDKIEAANKSELDRISERVTQAEAAAAKAEADALRFRVALKHGVSDEDADLFLTGTDEETLNKQAARLAERASDRKNDGLHVPDAGTQPDSPPDNEMRSFTRQLFGATNE